MPKRNNYQIFIIYMLKTIVLNINKNYDSVIKN